MKEVVTIEQDCGVHAVRCPVCSNKVTVTVGYMNFDGYVHGSQMFVEDRSGEWCEHFEEADGFDFIFNDKEDQT